MYGAPFIHRNGDKNCLRAGTGAGHQLAKLACRISQAQEDSNMATSENNAGKTQQALRLGRITNRKRRVAQPSRRVFRGKVNAADGFLPLPAPP